MDATLEQIKAAHKAAKSEMPACTVGLDAHKHRGWLLDLVDSLTEALAVQAQATTATIGKLREAERGARGEAPRPRVGPWVEDDKRYDAFGHEVAGVNQSPNGWRWWARVAFGPIVSSRGRGLPAEPSKEAARDAADAVLATWADLDGVKQGEAHEYACDVKPPVADALTQVRALLRRARLRLGGHPKDGNAASVAHDVQMVEEIDAFLAGLPVTPAPRTWTEEQIREALERASDRRDIDADEPLTLSSRGMWKALREVGS